jgi:hypothetical protein
MTWSRLDLGVGIVVSAGLDLLWDDIRHLVDVVEVESQTMWTPRQDSGWDLVEEAFRWVENLRLHLPRTSARPRSGNAGSPPIPLASWMIRRPLTRDSASSGTWPIRPGSGNWSWPGRT